MTGAKSDRPIYISTGLPIGLAFGASIWLLSATVTGRAEPWDAPGMYYPAALLAAGLVGGFVVPAHWGEVGLGIFTGQALVLLGRALSEPGGGSLWPLGLMLLAIYSLLGVVGGGLGSGLRRLLSRPPE